MESRGMYSTSMSSGMLGLEMSLQQHIPQQTPQNPHHMQQQHNPPHNMVPYGHHEVDKHPQAQHSVRQGFQQYAGKTKNQNSTLSDDEDPGLTAENSADDGKKILSPWQRVKWTDDMVRLLIIVVYYIGDEAGPEGNDPSGKKKGAGVLQKKGKWKSVSRAMMERGFSVSPQQCEDKFNDLNKRFKRVNDILGKGTACRVVENQALLETMNHLSPKMKEEVKKLLNSKHLFFREMCSYHNSCNHGGASSIAAAGDDAQHSPEVDAEPSQAQQQGQQQRCLHSSEHASIGPNLGRAETEGSKVAKGASGEEDDDNDDDDEDKEDVVEGGARSHEPNDDNDDRSSRKRQRKGVCFSPLIQETSTELMNVLQDGSKNPIEKRLWMKTRIIQLEEQRVGYQSQALELEKQRLKWEKFSSKKEREMERERLSNERLRLENERMVLLIRQKQLELLDLQQNKNRDPSTITG